MTRQQKRYATDPAYRTKAKQWAKDWMLANPEAYRVIQRRHQLKRKYDITLEDYSTLLGKQEGLCAICAQVLDRAKDTHVDHDHTTNTIRGLLCGKCNNGLGLFKDDFRTLRLAASYLERYAWGF